MNPEINWMNSGAPDKWQVVSSLVMPVVWLQFHFRRNGCNFAIKIHWLKISLHHYSIKAILVNTSPGINCIQQTLLVLECCYMDKIKNLSCCKINVYVTIPSLCMCGIGFVF